MLLQVMQMYCAGHREDIETMCSRLPTADTSNSHRAAKDSNHSSSSSDEDDDDDEDGGGDANASSSRGSITRNGLYFIIAIIHAT